MLALMMQSDARREKTRPPDHEVFLHSDDDDERSWLWNADHLHDRLAGGNV
jgi:hypothetical protein